MAQHIVSKQYRIGRTKLAKSGFIGNLHGNSAASVWDLYS